MKKILSYILFLTIVCSVVQAEDNTAMELDQEHWQDLKKGKDYDDFENEKLKKDKERSDEAFNPKVPSRNIINSLSSFAQILIVVIVAGVIGILIYIAIKNNRGIQGSKKVNQDLQIEIEHVEADLLNMDMPALIQKALELHDKQRELRLYYLWAIQMMDQLEILEWKREKTNSAYLRDLTGKELYWKFSHITNDINEITYGKTVKSHFYEALKPELVSLSDILQKLIQEKESEKAQNKKVN